VIVGEALNRRSDLQKRVAQVQQRLRASVLVQEGDDPAESAEELMLELSSLCDELQHLIGRINHTNANSTLSTGETVTDCLARRDVLELRRSGLSTAVRAATGDPLSRFTRSELRMVRQISVAEIQARIDALAKERRELDNVLQRHNWSAPLIE
jgi:hypothetical protein